MPTTRDDALALDRADPLATFRDRFALPPDTIYLDGNSLGALPKETAARVRRVVETEWGQDLIVSWNKHGWYPMPSRVGDKIARLVGARPGEVVCADSTSVNLFKLLAAALAMRPDRTTILSERGNFPTDLYVAQGLIEMLGGRPRVTTYGVCYNTDDTGMDYMCAIEVATFDAAPRELTRLSIGEHLYAHFGHHGHLTQIKLMWQAIFNDWLPASGYEIAQAPDFERYGEAFNPMTGKGLLELFVPVKKKA